MADFIPQNPNVEANISKSIEENIAVSVNISPYPTVILFGSPRLGKTVTLLRLCKYIESHYEIKADLRFRNDEAYPKTIKNFEELRSKDDLPASTDFINFIMVQAFQRGGGGLPIFQVLEAPGEDYFKPKESPNTQYKYYLQSLFSSSTKKVYVFFFTPDIFNDFGEERVEVLNAYIRKINDRLSQLNKQRDKVIILYNKCDINASVAWKNGKPNKEAYFASFKQDTNGVLNANLNRLDFQFIPFKAGNAAGGKFSYSADEFPDDLHDKIIALIKDADWLSKLFSAIGKMFRKK